MEKKQLSSPQTENNPNISELCRADKVKIIKQAVESGNYKIDDRSLADSLINDLLWDEWERKRLSEP
jgi:anti-sigma28 factor (negative regulator of flagellin synthesis)